MHTTCKATATSVARQIDHTQERSIAATRRRDGRSVAATEAAFASEHTQWSYKSEMRALDPCLPYLSRKV